MAGVFRPGQLVRLVEWHAEPAELENSPHPQGDGLLHHVIGSLHPNACALVVALHRSDGARVYVFGSHGGGWISGGLLSVVREPPYYYV